MNDSADMGLDLSQGIDADSVPDGGMVRGHIDGEAVILARRGDAFFAVGATCTHYGGPLDEGLFVGETVRCPWHHACFSLWSGEALEAPALDPLPCWRVEMALGNMVYVRGKVERHPVVSDAERLLHPRSVVIVGGGAAGNAAAETLRRAGYAGPITMLSAEETLPCDRPKLSKSYLSGATPVAENFLRSAEFYQRHEIVVELDVRVEKIDPAARRLHLRDGRMLEYGALLLATGAEPVRLDIPGADLGHVHYLRDVADSRAIAHGAADAGGAVVIGSGFIGLEAAAALRARGMAVHVVAPDAVPMERILGADVGRMIRDVHEAHGVVFHAARPARITERTVMLDDGGEVAADLVVVGIGVRPRLELAQDAGLRIENGVMVDAFLQTSAPDIYAAGDIARWPDRHSGMDIRVEHFAVAQRQGQVAARNMLGRQEKFDKVPFFWTEQHDLMLSYVGHAESWDECLIEGDLADRDCLIRYRRNGRDLAVATIGRDMQSLEAEARFAREVGGDAICEVVGIFDRPADLHAAIDDLMLSGFDRSQLSLLADEKTVEEKLGYRYSRAEELADDPRAPRAAYVEDESRGGLEGSLVGVLTYVGATAAAGAVVASGGTIAALIGAAVVAGGTGGVLGTLLAKWVGNHHADYLQDQIDRGGLLLWVRARDDENERRAREILRARSGNDVHTHMFPADEVAG